jgi:hypothetical protein
MEQENAPAPKRTREMARQKDMATDAAFRAIQQSEGTARAQKTEKLRLLRLQKLAEATVVSPAKDAARSKGAIRKDA